MTIAASPARSNPATTIYAGDEDVYHTDDNGDDKPGPSNTHPTLDRVQTSNKRESMYVQLFEEMIKIILVAEMHLFSHEELSVLRWYIQLSYAAKFLLVRLCLRKADKWFRLNDLKAKYFRELGENILKAIEELVGNQEPEYIVVSDDEETPAEAKVKLEGSHVKLETKVEEVAVSIAFDAGGSSIKLEPPQAGPSTRPNDSDRVLLVDGDDSISDRELLECLNVDELRDLAKSMKVKFKKDNKNLKREQLTDALISSASSQTTLSFSVTMKSKFKDRKTLKQTRLPFSPQRSQSKRLRELVMNKLEKCIRVRPEVTQLFRRLHLVYYRCTQYSEDFMTPSILARCKKRTYAKYEYQRTRDIWSSRDDLLEYEKALLQEYQIDDIMDDKGMSVVDRERSMASRTPAFRLSTAPPSTPGSTITAYRDLPVTTRRVEGEESSRIKKARAVKELFKTPYETWKSLLLVKPEEGSVCDQRLERFDIGHVLTRIVCKGANALGQLKEHEEEFKVLIDLLSQTRWRRSKRGRWHDRCALILMTHMPKTRETFLAAKDVVEKGLNDPYTHSIWRPKLQRRLVTLEKRLKIEDRHVVTGRLEKAHDHHVVGVRIHKFLDTMGRPVTKIADPGPSGLDQWINVLRINPEAQKKAEVKYQKAKGKSVWKGEDGEEVSVEILALQHYESKGYKGHHCEGRFLYMIYGLLFWDIIFAPIPGAFETPFQTAPLDIAYETFYSSRKELIDQRILEIRQGKAAELLEATDDMYRETAPWCVGVRWDVFEKQDLLDVVNCLGGPSLSELCLIISEDYSSRAGGLPDLVIWDMSRDEEKCMFVEVKGPGDSLMENQKTWLDLLIRAEVPVALCLVREEGTEEPRTTKRKVAAKKAKRKYDSDQSEEDELESEEEDNSPRKRQRPV